MSASQDQHVTQGWLVKDARVLASLEMPKTRKAKAKGLLGRDSIEGAILLADVKSVHTVAMKFDIDVAFLDENNHVIKLTRMPPNRVSPFVMKAKSVIEAEAGALAKWGVEIGDELEVRE